MLSHPTASSRDEEMESWRGQNICSWIVHLQLPSQNTSPEYRDLYLIKGSLLLGKAIKLRLKNGQLPWKYTEKYTDRTRKNRRDYFLTYPDCIKSMLFFKLE